MQCATAIRFGPIGRADCEAWSCKLFAGRNRQQQRGAKKHHRTTKQKRWSRARFRQCATDLSCRKNAERKSKYGPETDWLSGKRPKARRYTGRKRRTCRRPPRVTTFCCTRAFSQRSPCRPKRGHTWAGNNGAGLSSLVPFWMHWNGSGATASSAQCAAR